MPRSISLYFQPRLIAIMCMGFSSGLPLALTASTLSAWLKKAGVDLTTIGLFSAAATPYALKFLWAPLMDGLRAPVLCGRLGLRRGWLLAMQMALVASILALGCSDPATSISTVLMLTLLVAFFSASQDIVTDAYRVEILKPEQYGAGAAMAMFGYRIGMIVSGAGALYLADYVSWFAAYAVMAALMGVGMLAVLLSPEPEMSGKWQVASDKEETVLTTCHLPLATWFRRYVVAPFADFMQREQWAMILLFIMLYKLGDAFMGMMVNPFLLDIGFSMSQIANVVKIYGVAATIVGTFIGGAIVARLGMTRSLWICGIGHAVTNLMFVVQARAGADLNLLAIGITLENITGGMSIAAFVAYMSSLTSLRFTATQYALLSSIAVFGRNWLSAPAGWVAKTLGWEAFFLFSAALAIPALLVLRQLKHR